MSDEPLPDSTQSLPWVASRLPSDAEMDVLRCRRPHLFVSPTDAVSDTHVRRGLGVLDVWPQGDLIRAKTLPPRPILCRHPDDRRVDYPAPTGTVCTVCGVPCPVRRGLEDE